MIRSDYSKTEYSQEAMYRTDPTHTDTKEKQRAGALCSALSGGALPATSLPDASTSTFLSQTGATLTAAGQACASPALAVPGAPRVPRRRLLLLRLSLALALAPG